MKEYAPVAKSGDCQSKSDHFVAVKRAQNLTTGFRGDYKQRQRHVEFCFAPHAALKFKTFLKFVQAVAVADGNFSGLRGGVHRRAFRASAGADRRAFALFQSVSSSAGFKSASFFPAAVDSVSMSRKRSTNFRFAFFSAISGSSFRKRTTLTTENKRSAASDSISARFPLAISDSSS